MPTEFKDLASGHVSYGFRFFSDYCAYYDNTWEEMPSSPEEIWMKICREGEPAVQDFIDDILHSGEQVIIGSKLFSADELFVMSKDQ